MTLCEVLPSPRPDPWMRDCQPPEPSRALYYTSMQMGTGYIPVFIPFHWCILCKDLGDFNLLFVPVQVRIRIAFLFSSLFWSVHSGQVPFSSPFHFQQCIRMRWHPTKRRDSDHLTFMFEFAMNWRSSSSWWLKAVLHHYLNLWSSEFKGAQHPTQSSTF